MTLNVLHTASHRGCVQDVINVLRTAVGTALRHDVDGLQFQPILFTARDDRRNHVSKMIEHRTQHVELSS